MAKDQKTKPHSKHASQVNASTLSSSSRNEKSRQQTSKGKGKATDTTSSSTAPRPNKKSKAAPGKAKVSSSSGDEDDGSIASDSEDDGVDEEGMARLMKALGEEGLDEMGQAELEALAGSEEEDESGGSEDGVQDYSEAESDEDEGSDEELVADAPLSDESSDDEGEEDEEQLEIPLDEASDVDEDAVPRQKIEIDNKLALDQIRESIQLDASLPWTETLALSYPHTIDVDVDDDLNRELAFYKQALHSANAARALAAKHSFAFTRPADYFAEMVKSDAHMERIRIRLLNESSGIKRSEDKRKEREGKKFGKQVQIEKLKEREKSKKEMDDRLKALKRKRKDTLDVPRDNDDQFDVAVEDAISERPAKRGKGANGKGIARSARDKKFGFGGAGRRSKQNTKSSTDDFDPSKAGRGKKGTAGGKDSGRHKSKRLGKSKRQAIRSR